MADLIDMKVHSSEPRLDAAETPAGLRAVFRALVGRLGTPEVGYGLGSQTLPGSLSIHEMEFGLHHVPVSDRFGRSNAWETGIEPGNDDGDDAQEPPAPTARATAMAHRLARLRANAHAAYASVDGRHEAALDTALAVMEAELRALSNRADAQAEILKQVRLYARDAECRSLAARDSAPAPRCWPVVSWPRLAVHAIRIIATDRRVIRDQDGHRLASETRRGGTTVYEFDAFGEDLACRAIKVSIIVACRNGEKTLGETLHSLVVQEWTEAWEIVFVDNGSTDKSMAIFEDFAARCPSVSMRCIDASDKTGKAHALNTGIRAAQGRSLLFCDADDTVQPDWLAAMGAALETKALVASRMDVRVLNPEWLVSQRRQEQDTGLGVIPHQPFCPMAGGATLGFHREVFEATDGFDPAFRFMEDDDFCIRAALAGFVMQYVPNAVYNYRYRSEIDDIYRQGYNYSYYRGLLRKRYANESAYAVQPWLYTLHRVGILQLRRLAATLLRKRRSPGDQARLMRQLGTAVGDLAGSLAFGVAPPIPRVDKKKTTPPALAQLRHGRRALRWVLRRFAGSILTVRTEDNLIALTFDDGPDPATTPAILDALAKRKMTARQGLR